MVNLWACRTIRRARSSFPELTHVHRDNTHYRCEHLQRTAVCLVSSCKACLKTETPLEDLEPLSEAGGHLEIIEGIILPPEADSTVVRLFNNTDTVEQAVWIAQELEAATCLGHPIARIAA